MGKKRYAQLQRQVRRILEDRLTDDLVTSPKYPEHLFLDNIVQPVLAHLFAQWGGRAQLLAADSAGNLKISQATPVLFASLEGSAVDAWSSLNIRQSGYRVTRTDVWITTNDAQIRFMQWSGTSSDEIHIVAGGFYSFDYDYSQFQIKNTTPGSNAAYQVVGWQVEE